ncbi:glycosyltransferase [Rhodoferax antarcticus]|uniref:Putative glycosyl transferase group 1 n=1 Tax=Rhodoferax antarcticus ANT.BR TaxID=1111071 RepID=A0A1Q8YHD9_9BURK|nr:glycosyltransferase [Rhodoferax antarcticus]APW45091.1 glycosyl transferase family 1 [Rhodoferax antarcticus]OLP07310.1 putative glycosyl transferase group 1 [Rhodoferax antarcticus ANT.BR]
MPPPQVLVFSSLFPSEAQPSAGVFVRERMFNVARQLPLCVVSPKPWFPLQCLLRLIRPHFRPSVARHVVQSGIDVFQPRYLSFPGVLKQFDGYLMALGAWWSVRRLHQQGRVSLIDAHFAYPDGYAATLLGRWLGIPVTITLRGTEHRHALDPALRPLLQAAFTRASHIFSVSQDLCRVPGELGVPASKLQVVGNGIDTDKFQRTDKAVARQALNLAMDERVLVSVGGLVERKGFHRVIEVLPELIREFGNLRLLVVGGATAEGNNRAELEQLVQRLKLQGHVQFLGPRPHNELANILSAADVFVLATRNEGWANVFLEAMACGLPVVTTDVGGNREVVTSEDYGLVVPFDDPAALRAALATALHKRWDAAQIEAYARSNAWSTRVETLLSKFKELTRG